MFHFDYLTEGTCSKVISMDLDGNAVRNMKNMRFCGYKTFILQQSLLRPIDRI